MARRQWTHLRAHPEVVMGWLGTAGVVVLVYLAVIRGGELLFGEPTNSLTLSTVATVVVAVIIDPVQNSLEAVARRLLRGGSSTPYEVLTQLSSGLPSPDPRAELPQLMARLLAEGTAAEWAQVWVLVNGSPSLMATHPVDAAADTRPPAVGGSTDDGNGLKSVTVGYGGTVLGVLRVQECPGRPLTPMEERLYAGLAAQAGLALHTAQLRAELRARHHELTVRAAQLRTARDQLVHVQDQERRRLERDIHDGAQQQLVALQINLRLAQALSERDPERAAALLAEQSSAAEEAISTLSTLSRGALPRVLSERGLPDALALAASGCPVPVHLTVGDVGRLSPAVEASAYFCCLEALQNAVKHAGATAIEVTLTLQDETLHLTVTDNGNGITAESVPGAGLSNMQDRLTAVAGSLHIASRPCEGTTVSAALPAFRLTERLNV
jgi:signal transduction histidine kinase